MTKFPEKKIRIMLHALGISHAKNGSYIEPYKRYSPYPTSYRNYYQISYCEFWNYLSLKGLAKFVKGEKECQNFYYVTDTGKDFLKNIGYKWH